MWNHNLVVDGFLGQALLMAPSTGKSTVHKEDLYGRRSKKTEKMKGNVTVEIETYDDLTAI